MEHAMTKKTLDTWGGVGSMLVSIVCLYFAEQHRVHESIWTVWVVMFVLLMLNGVAMVLWARRNKNGARQIF